MARCTKMIPRCYARANNPNDCTCSPRGSGKSLEDRIDDLERKVAAIEAERQAA